MLAGGLGFGGGFDSGGFGFGGGLVVGFVFFVCVFSVSGPCGFPLLGLFRFAGRLFGCVRFSWLWRCFVSCGPTIQETLYTVQ